MDSYYIFLLDRINRIIRILSRFPYETVKTTSAFRRKLSLPDPTIENPGFLLRKIAALNLIVARYLHREAIRIFPVSSGNRKS